MLVDLVLLDYFANRLNWDQWENVIGVEGLLLKAYLIWGISVGLHLEIVAAQIWGRLVIFEWEKLVLLFVLHTLQSNFAVVLENQFSESQIIEY